MFMDSLLDTPTPEVIRDDLPMASRMKDKLQKSGFWFRCLREAVHLGQMDSV